MAVPPLSTTDLDELVTRVRRDAPLASSPIHGEHHWSCVAVLASHIAARTPGADMRLAQSFAVLHDCRRQSEDYDPAHGARAAELTLALHADGTLAFDVASLAEACARHSDGDVTTDPTIAACWDADRLCRTGRRPMQGNQLWLDPAADSQEDITREVPVRVDPSRLSTAAARDPSLAAFARRLSASPDPVWHDVPPPHPYLGGVLLEHHPRTRRIIGDTCPDRLISGTYFCIARFDDGWRVVVRPPEKWCSAGPATSAFLSETGLQEQLFASRDLAAQELAGALRAAGKLPYRESSS